MINDDREMNPVIAVPAMFFFFLLIMGFTLPTVLLLAVLTLFLFIHNVIKLNERKRELVLKDDLSYEKVTREQNFTFFLSDILILTSAVGSCAGLGLKYSKERNDDIWLMGGVVIGLFQISAWIGIIDRLNRTRYLPSGLRTIFLLSLCGAVNLVWLLILWFLPLGFRKH